MGSLDPIMFLFVVTAETIYTSKYINIKVYFTFELPTFILNCPNPQNVVPGLL